SSSEQVSRRDLSLPLGKHPVLDAHTFPRAGIGPASHIARGENPGGARFEVLIDHDPAIDTQPALLSECGRRPHSHPEHHEICIEAGSAPQNHSTSLETADRVLQMEGDTVRFVEAAYELPDLGTHHTLQRFLFKGHHVDHEPACTQGCSNLEADEAATNDDDLLCRCGLGHECAAVCVATKI